MNDQDRISAAIAYIKSKVTELIPGAMCEHGEEKGGGVYRFVIALPEKNQITTELVFSEENMEDFSADQTDYGIRFRYYVDFKIYIGLIKAGMIPFFRISQRFMQEAVDRRKNDWWSDQYVRVSFNEKFTVVLTNGLKKLKELVEGTFNENVVDADRLCELKEALDLINGIISYYNVHKSLDETAASIKSLAILKSAAIYIIFEKEKMRDERPYRTRAINDEICWIALMLREGAFLEVRPPDWLVDYVAV